MKRVCLFVLIFSLLLRTISFAFYFDNESLSSESLIEYYQNSKNFVSYVTKYQSKIKKELDKNKITLCMGYVGPSVDSFPLEVQPPDENKKDVTVMRNPYEVNSLIEQTLKEFDSSYLSVTLSNDVSVPTKVFDMERGCGIMVFVFADWFACFLIDNAGNKQQVNATKTYNNIKWAINKLRRSSDVTTSPNWYQENGYYRLRDAQGYTITNAWVCDDTDDQKPWYLLDLNGNMVAGVAQDNGTWYSFGNDGRLRLNSGNYDGVYLAITSSGAIQNPENAIILAMKYGGCSITNTSKSIYMSSLMNNY